MVDPRSIEPRRTGRRGRLRRGRRLPMLLLLVSLGVAAVAVVHAQQAVRSHQATAEGLLRDYAAFASWNYRKQFQDEFRAVVNQAMYPPLRARHRGDSMPPVTALLEHERNVAGSPCAPVYGAPWYFHFDPEDDRLSIAGEEPAGPVRLWLTETLPAYLREEYGGWPMGLISGQMDGSDLYIAYTVIPRDGSPHHVYGFEVDPERMRPLFEKIMEDSPLLPAGLMNGRGNAEIVTVEVAAANGGALYTSEAGADWSLAAEDTMTAGFAGLTVRAAVHPQVASSLIIGGLPRSRLPFLFGLLALAVALTGVAVGQLRREGQLARLRSDFVSSASHELRTPLAQLRLFLETLRLGRYSGERQREWILENLDRETVRLTNLVDNVLHFSRGERGAPHGDRQAVALNDYLAQVVDAFRPLAASRRVRIEVESEPGLGAPLHAESFRQVVLNLLDNAVKYGPAGQTVRVHASTAAPDRIRITVEDEGPGVAPAERERIWEPFQRGREAVGSVAVGSGIGLSVVREIVSRHGGRAWVEAGVPRGARFVVEVPGWREAPPAPPEMPSADQELLRGVG